MRRRRSTLALLAAALACAPLPWGCGLCERSDAADGTYEVLSDCSGDGLARGTLIIGSAATSRAAAASPCTPGAPDAGVHLAESPGDAGAAAPPCTEEGGLDELCPDTEARGALGLGLPSRVRVRGARDFELYGEIDGRALTCTPEDFGDERILFCRAGGRVVCAATFAR